MKALTTTEYSRETPNAYVANGFVGLTVPLLPFECGEARVSGCYERSEEHESEQVASLPFPVRWAARVDGHPLAGEASAFRSQSYDFATGELCTRAEYRVQGKPVAVEDLLFCSRSAPAVVLRRLTVQCSNPCRLSVQASIDPSPARGSLRAAHARHEQVDWVLRWGTAGALSSLGAALLLQASAPGEAVRERVDPLTVRSTLELAAGQQAVFTQIAALVPERLHPEPHWEALRLARSAAWRGFEALRAENRRAWQELWRGRIRLLGADPSWQELADSALFYLFSSAHASAPCSIPPFGLSSSGYGGHVFWDTETFMFPPLLLLAPEAAQALLRYRVACLPAARANAALNGYRGAMFPWESGASGSEVTPVWAPTSEEHHISLDVAFACLQYAWAGADTVFVRNELWPLLEAVCRWIESRVVRTERGCEIRNVVGIDEGIENVDNNSYTNIAARIVLEQSSLLAGQLGLPAHTERWRETAAALFIPVDEKLGIILKHDRYRYEGGPCVPETLAAFFPLTYRHPDPAVERATYDYHLGLADTVLHFPMLSSLFGVWAARRGQRRRSLECFTRGIMEFSCQPYRSFSEWRGQNRPLFLTNPAGFLTACLYGLTGLQLDSGDPLQWGRFPIVMPEGWEGVEAERIWVRGRPAALRARQGAPRAGLQWIEG